MPADKVPDLSPLTAKLTRRHRLSDDDRAALHALPVHVAAIAERGEIVRADERADRCAIVLAGVAFGYKLTGSGRRQIMGLHLAGDLPDLQSLHLGTTDTGVAAASECQVGYISQDALKDLCLRRSSLAIVLWHETLLQAAMIREWLLNVGRRGALARIAHLMCEMMVRQQASGLASGNTCSFPLPQVALSDALGLSTVHVNRMLQELRGQDMIRLDRTSLEILNWERLRALADFDPAYLHLKRASSAALP